MNLATLFSNSLKNMKFILYFSLCEGMYRTEVNCSKTTTLGELVFELVPKALLLQRRPFFVNGKGFDFVILKNMKLKEIERILYTSITTIIMG